MDSFVENYNTQLERYDWKQQFGWCHRIAPILVTQSLLVLHVIKTGDIFFDVTGIVNFNLLLLILVTSFHLLIWEIMTSVRKAAREKLEAVSGFHNQILQDMSKMTRLHISELQAGLQKSKKVGRNQTADVEKAATDVKITTSTATQTIAPSTSKQDERTRALTSFSLSSSSSSICVIPDVSSSSSSDSASYCVLSSGASSSQGSSYSSSCSGTFSDSCSSAAETDDSLVVISDNQQSMIFVEKDIEDLSSQKQMPSTCNHENGNKLSDLNRFPGIPLEVADDRVQQTTEASSVARAQNVNNRLKLLQDVYIVVDIFKALVCLDALRHLWFYYSLYYWRVSIFQMIQVFIVPSLVVLAEVSVTIVFYIP